ncbi:unnamed protein product [Alopecurus aequalis]
MAPVSLAFMVRRGELELVKPAGPTLREVKRLSDLDDQEGFRFYISLIFFYWASPRPDDPVRVIRHGLANALVHYYQVCHCLVDAAGVVQFLQAVGELAGGMEAPRVRPVWARELFQARDPPRVQYQHPEYELPADAANDKLHPGDKLVHSAFVFGAEEISVLREQLPPPMRSRCSRFMLLSAFMWRCRTMALGYEPGDEVRFMFLMNARVHEKLPKGFYGNALTFGVARTTAGELCSATLGGGVELIVAAMARIMANDYAQSVADALVLRGRPRFTTARTYLVTDLTKLKMHEVDLGWGMPVYGGPASRTMATFHIPAISVGITVAMCLSPKM